MEPPPSLLRRSAISTVPYIAIIVFRALLQANEFEHYIRDKEKERERGIQMPISSDFYHLVSGAQKKKRSKKIAHPHSHIVSTHSKGQ